MDTEPEKETSEDMEENKSVDKNSKMIRIFVTYFSLCRVRVTMTLN